jgi:hypothetical protein
MKNDLLIQLYTECTRTPDQLAYTPEFDRLVVEYQRLSGEKRSHRELLNALISLRKNRRLPRRN